MVERRSRSEERAEVNRNVRMAVKRFDIPGIANDSWDFLCECGAEDCKDWVTLTLEQYEERRQLDEPILAAGHKLSRGKPARRKSEALIDGAKALRAQAEVQARRSDRGRGKST
ncbi:MAG: hypothetical protein ACRDLM_07045 [Gaiellaceae bacterium]